MMNDKFSANAVNTRHRQMTELVGNIASRNHQIEKLKEENRVDQNQLKELYTDSVEYNEYIASQILDVTPVEQISLAEGAVEVAIVPPEEGHDFDSIDETKIYPMRQCDRKDIHDVHIYNVTTADTGESFRCYGIRKRESDDDKAFPVGA